MIDTFSKNNALLRRNPEGLWRIYRNFPNDGIVDFRSINSGGHTLRGYRINDDLYSLVSTEPLNRYRKILDMLIPDPIGGFHIEGKFPIYWYKKKSNEIVPVFLDYDGNFSTQPIDFVARLTQYHRDLAANAARQKRIDKTRKQLSYRHKISIKANNNSSDYTWTVSFEGVEVATGRALSHVKAERDAEKRVREIRVALAKNVR